MSKEEERAIERSMPVILHEIIRRKVFQEQNEDLNHKAQKTEVLLGWTCVGIKWYLRDSEDLLDDGKKKGKIKKAHCRL